jgi:DNA polymerase-3 subunit gamma/tau
LADGDAAGLIRTIATIDEQFPDYGRLLDDLTRLLQRVAVYQAVGATDSDDDLAESEIAGFAERMAAEDLQLFYQTALIGRRDLDLAPDPRSGVEMTLLRMLTFQPRRSSDTDEPGASAAAASTQRQPASPGKLKVVEPPQAKSGLAELQQPSDWGKVIQALELTGAAKLLAANCAWLRRDEDTVYLGLDRRSESLLTRSRQQAIAEALSARFGQTLRVEITVAASAAETPIQEQARRSDEKLEAARESLEADPNVKALRDMFGAQLNPDSIEPIDSKANNSERIDKTRSATRE